MRRVAVLGAGSWGTALALFLLKKGCQVSLWVWDADQASVMRRSGENPFLPGFQLPNELVVTTSMAEAVGGSECVVFAVVSEGVMEVAEGMRSYLPSGVPVISGTKGLIGESGRTVSQVLSSMLGVGHPVAAMSGPNLAVELARGIPTATVVACEDAEIACVAQELFMGPTFRVYTNADVLGVELAGALKNVIAIAAGMCDGLGYGDNTKAALVTRGLAEITRLGVEMGARRETFMGLAGVGDLMATCVSPLSRNRRAGYGLGQGRELEDILREIGQVVEGVPTTRAAYGLANRLGVPMPITEQVYRVLFEGKMVQEAAGELMSRAPKEEIW